MAANSVVAGVLIARYLGADSLGVYLVLATAIQILIQIGGCGLHMTINYLTAGQPEKLIPAGVNAIGFGVISGCICAGFLWIMSPGLLPGVPADLTLVGLVVVPFQVVTTMVISLFFAQGEIKKFNLIDLLNQSFVLVNAITALVILGGGLWLLVSLNALAGVVVAVIALSLFYAYASRRFPERRWTGDRKLMGSMLRYSSRGFILWISTLLIYRFDLMIVNYFRGSTEAAVYAVATQCTMFLLLLPNVVSFVLQARVAATQDAGGEFTARVARHTSLILFVACLVTVPGALAVAAVYGPGFEKLPLLCWILLPGIFLVGVQSVISQYFVGTGMPMFLAVAWVLTLVLSILMNLAAVPRFGAVGAAVVSSICYASISVAIFYFFHQKTGLGGRAILFPHVHELRQLQKLLKAEAHDQNADRNIG